MMLAWSFAAHTHEDVANLLKALGKHRYVKEVDHRIHFTVDLVLRDLPMFAPHAQAFDQRRASEPDLDVASREPTLWRRAPVEEVIEALRAFWNDEGADERSDELFEVLIELGFPIPEHEAFETSAEDPPFPELIMLDWVLLPIDELDPDRHRGVLEALDGSSDEVSPSAPIYQEGPTISAIELTEGAVEGDLADEFLVWSDGPYPYVDYVFRGASKVARLPEPPTGYRDLDKEDEFESGEEER